MIVAMMPVAVPTVCLRSMHTYIVTMGSATTAVAVVDLRGLGVLVTAQN